MSNTKLGLGEALLRPFTAPRPSSEAGQAPVQGQSQPEKIAAAHTAILAILENTHWPRKSEESVKSLVDVIKQVPPLPSPPRGDTSREPPDIDAEQLVSALQNVRTKLDAAASRHGASTKSTAIFHRSETCNQVLNTCREEIKGALASLRSTATDTQIEAGTTSSDNSQAYQTPPALEQATAPDNTGDRPDATRTSDKQPEDPSKTATALNEESTIKRNPSADTERRKERLDWANKALKGVEMASGSIPIVGSYVGAAAKIGVACVELAQLADQNEEAANMLDSRTTRLSEILGQFKGGSSNKDNVGATKLVQELQKELQGIQEEVKVLNSSSAFRKMWSSNDHADKLKEFQEKIRIALEELQLLVNLRTSDLIAEISSNQVREENDRLLNLLGDANYGAQGYAIEDVICLPGTRVAILERIENWIRGGNDSKQVLWILGMAGRGKSTLASTVAYRWQNRASCAIFHFRRGQTELQRRLICALARQLGTCTASPVKHAILQSIRDNKDIAQGRLETQFQFLIRALETLEQSTPIILIVDALDECEDVDYAVRFVQLIRSYAGLLPLDIKILLTCRPEAQLLVHLRQAKWEEESLDLETNMDEGEIRLFMEYELSRIRENHNLPKSWPHPAAIETLVKGSQRLFQWSRTAIKYIASGSPKHRLDELLALPSINDGLDGLYKPILSKAYEKLKKSRIKVQLLVDILGLLVVTPYPISIEIIAYLYSDYNSLRGQTESDRADYLKEEVLADLSSLLSLPSSSNHFIRLGHTSLRDLLVSSDRCGEELYFIDVHKYHRLVATISFGHMLRDLRRNICNLSDLSTPNTEIQEAVSHYVPKGLQYCCRSWLDHLCASSPNQAPETSFVEGLADLERFSKEKLLGWIEVMSLIGEMKESTVLAEQAKLWLEQFSSNPECTSLAALWNDAYRLITEFQAPLSFGALHVYSTAISFCPRNTKLWEYYGGDADTLFLHGQPRNEWSAELWSRSTGASLGSVAYSPDGKTIASTYGDMAVCLWDAETGLPAGRRLEGHSKRVTAVTFSPDGSRVASGSDDGTVRVWDVQTGLGIGECLRTPLPHENQNILCVKFSPDGKKIVTGWDNALRLWDTKTQQPIGTPFQGHTDTVYTVAFSPDGERIASGSADGTFRLWNTETALQIGETFEAGGVVNCVVFSPNGRFIALSSGGSALILDSRTGLATGESLGSHNHPLSIAFSPDGKTIACGYGDHKLRLWDIETRVAIGQPLVGHTVRVWSVAFSPDGKKIVSSSDDQTIRMWDLALGVLAEIPSEGDTSGVRAIAISPMAEKIATGSDDGQIALWHARTGFPVCEPWEGHRGSVTCVTFSPDGQRIASSSWDGTIRIWDVDARNLVGEPFQGSSGDWIEAVAWSPDGGVLASGVNGRNVSLWNGDTLLPLGVQLEGNECWATCIAFSPDCRRIAAGSYCQIFLWDLQTQTDVGKLSLGDSGDPISVAFSSDGSMLSAELSDGKLCTWDLETMQSTGSSGSIDFPEPFRCLRVREQWLFYKDRRMFWLPLDYKPPGRLPVILQGDVLFCLGRKRCTFNISQTLPYFPSLALKPVGGLHTFTVASTRLQVSLCSLVYIDTGL